MTDYRKMPPEIAAALDRAVTEAVFSVYIALPAPLLIDDKRRCMNCQCAFDAEFVWHHTREHWIERPDYCPQCSDLRTAAIAGLFSGIAELAGGHMTLDIESFGTADFAKGGHIDFEKASPTGRRLAPFISPIGDEYLLPKGRLSYPFVQPRHTTRVQIVDVDFAVIEQRVAAVLGLKDVLFDEIAQKCGIDLRVPEPVGVAPAKKRPPEYLKHDPTKKHKRRKC